MANTPAKPKAPAAPVVETKEVAPTPAAPVVETKAPAEATATIDLVHVTRKGNKQVMQVTREHYDRYSDKLDLVSA